MDNHPEYRHLIGAECRETDAGCGTQPSCESEAGVSASPPTEPGVSSNGSQGHDAVAPVSIVRTAMDVKSI